MTKQTLEQRVEELTLLANDLAADNQELQEENERLRNAIVNPPYIVKEDLIIESVVKPQLDDIEKNGSNNRGGGE